VSEADGQSDQSAEHSTEHSSEHRAAIRVIEGLRAKGHVAFLAGGCVRDLLLGVEPKDFDVATDAKPDEIKGYFRKTASVGAAFGVMLVRDFGCTIEVATFRSDGVYSDARRPDSVEFSSPEEDAQRRDFTINALFMDPFAENESERIIDLVNGLPDVHNRVLRAVGEPGDRLREDHLRALRGVRFAAKYNLTIEPKTHDAIREDAKSLSGVSIERIGEECRKMLLHSSRDRACTLIDELGLDDAIFGDVRPFDSWVMAELSLQIGDMPYPLALAALAIGRGYTISDDPSKITRHYRKALDLSNTDRDAMRAILECMRSFDQQWGTLGEAGRKRLASRQWACGALSIYRAMELAGGEQVAHDIETLADRFGGLCPEPLVTGGDLIEHGLTPGPAFKALLDEVYDEQLEGRITTKPQAIGFIREQAGEK
tara:strand:- start:17913 stop:19196 length:1284 start_codon:yes stop_codon:yes gene_type:complete